MKRFDEVTQIIRVFFRKQAWLIIFISLALLAFIFSAYFYQYTCDPSLRSSYIQTTWTVIGVLIGAIGVYDFIMKQNEHPIPELLVNRGTRVDVRIGSQSYETSVDISFINSGNKSIRPSDFFYYTILVPDSIYNGHECIKKNSEGDLVGPQLRTVTIAPGYKTLASQIDNAIHPQRHIKEFKLKLKFTKTEECGIKYFFSSERGYLPNGVNADELTGLGQVSINVSMA